MPQSLHLNLKPNPHTMKPKSILKWLTLVGSSFILSAAMANADPDPDKKDDKDNKEKSERVEKKNKDKPGKKADKSDKPQVDRGENKQERAEDRKEKVEDRKERAEDKREQTEQRQERIEDRREKVEDRQEKVEDRAERIDDRREKAEDKRERVEDRQEKREDRRIYKRGEFRERFVDRDRDHIVTYFSNHKGHARGLPPGLAQKWESGRRLPNGWRDRVVTGYVIEDEWRPYFEPVPYSWFPGITVVPDTQLYWYGDRVVRVYEPTHEVVDVVVVPTIHIDL